MSNSRQTAKKKTTGNTGTKRSSTKTASARNSSRSGKNSSGKKTQNKNQNSGIEREIGLVALLLVCVFLFVSNFGVGGAVGKFLSGVLFGLFGLFAYLLPVLVLLMVLFSLANRENLEATLKIAGVVLCAVAFCALMHMLMPNAPEEIKDVYTYCKTNRIGGGLLGGIVAILLKKAVGTVGTYLVLLGILIICVVIITGRSFVDGMSHGSQRVYESAREDMARRRELADERREQQRARARELKEQRQERKVTGVTMDVTIPKQENGLIEVTEPDSVSFADPAQAQMPVEQEVPVQVGTPVHSYAVEPELYQEYPAAEPMQSWSSPDAEINFSEEDLLKNAMNTRDLDETEPVHVMEASQAETTQAETFQTEISQAEISQAEISQTQVAQTAEAEYEFPPLSLLKKPKASSGKKDDNVVLQETAEHLQQVMEDFGVNATVVNASRGPAVTRYEVQPAHGVKVSKILALADDIKLNLAVADVRIEAPIPGKAAVGIEVPNKENSTVMFRELVESKEFREHKSKIAFAVGKDIGGNIMVSDIAKMPHLLIAGATGSGKSVCINTLIMSILYKARPDEVKLIMIDPKVVELSAYNGIPHLLIPVVTDPKKAAGALNWAVAEMMGRYNQFAELNVRNIEGYNEKIDSIKDIPDDNKREKMPQIVIIVDELADLMMVAPGEVEDAICRLAQLARAAGIHLIIATQRPSVNVITGLIKANMPSRIAFAVSSGVDSRTILDMNGAEKLLGKGDMLFSPYGIPKPLRVQGAFVSDAEVGAVVEFLSSRKPEDSQKEQEIAEKMKEMQSAIENVATSSDGSSGSDKDVLFAEAGRFIIEKDKASIGMLQRWFKIGFNRAARIMDQLADAGVVGEEEGTKPRKVLMSSEQFEQYIEEQY